MKFFIKVACLVTFMAQTHMANAENWVKVTVNPLGAAYIDADVATRDGDVVKFSELTDLKMAETINGRLILSRKSLVEHDCKKLTRRVLALSTFSEQMATGDTIYASEVPRDWTPISLGSTGNAVFDYVCLRF